jgi:hypothetical protein
MISFFKKIFGGAKKVVNFYDKPKDECSSLILLSGPSYGDKTFFASFFLDVVACKEWSLDHSKSIWCSDKAEQEARVFIPEWFSTVTRNDDSYITLIDPKMRSVLVPYSLDFYQKGWLNYYCHGCHEFHDSMIDNTSEVVKDGSNRSWVEEWQCLNGHIIHHKEQELRWIVRK